MIKKFIGEVSQLEKKLYFLFPIVIVTAMFVFGTYRGWDELRKDTVIYLNLILIVGFVFLLMKKTTYTLGYFYLSLMENAAFQGVPKKVILMRYQLMMWGSSAAAIFAYISGIYFRADLVIMFSWSLLGMTVASERLIKIISTVKE